MSNSRRRVSHAVRRCRFFGWLVLPMAVTALPMGAAHGQLMHRYSFNEIGGAGTTLLDSIGGRHGTIVNVGSNDATVSDGRVTLSGGSRNNSDYVAFPSGLLTGMQSFTGDATIELWGTQLSVQSWGRLFDFGSGAESNLFMSWSMGTNDQSDRYGFKTSGSETNGDGQLAPYTLGQRFHVAMTIASGAGPGGQTQINVYKDGVLKATANTSQTLSQLVDTDNFLGRSQYSSDLTANASYDEFRLYNAALSGSAVALNTTLGPDVLSFSEPSPPDPSQATVWRIDAAGGSGIQSAPRATGVHGLVVEQGFGVEYLIVGGGGAGGSTDSGGGGAGGVVSGTAFVSSQNYGIDVGAGGVPVQSQWTRGGNGQSSSAFGITAFGGGGGGSGQGADASNRVSGSGASSGGVGSTWTTAANRGESLQSQGQQGGFGSASQGGGGGGGAGGSGGNGPNGNGGFGVQSRITGSAAYYGDGGGGGHGNTTTGGSGRGGQGFFMGNGTAGQANSGSGGGGGGANHGTGGAGGSGTVILRYAGEPLMGLSATSTDGIGSVSQTSFTGDGSNGIAGQAYQVHAFTIGTSTTSGQFSFDLSEVNLGDMFNATMSGTISGAGSLTYNGPGTLVLTAANTFEGGTIVGGGMLVAANVAALGSGTVTISPGATLRLADGTLLANMVVNSGTLQFAGGGLRRLSTGSGTWMELIAGTQEAPLALNPSVAWLGREAAVTFSDVLSLTQTAGAITILQMPYDMEILGATAESDLMLGWKSGESWLSAIAGNIGGDGSLVLRNQIGSFSDLGISATSDYLGSWGRDPSAGTVWAVIDHNSQFAVIAVPEPSTAVLGGFAALLASGALLHDRFRMVAGHRRRRQSG